MRPGRASEGGGDHAHDGQSDTRDDAFERDPPRALGSLDARAEPVHPVDE